MRHFSAKPQEMVASAWRHRSLIKTLTKREVLGRYRGSVLGMAWSLLTPLLMLAVYTFVFSVVFKARWSAGSDSKTEFALILFAGLLVFNLFAECVTRAPGLILANSNYVKKVVFPLEILPWVVLGSALFHFGISLLVWLTAYLVLVGTPHWTLVLIPLILAPFALFVLGMSWLLASLGVYLRDVGQFIGIFVQMLVFMTPIFYPASALPESFQRVLFLNPLTPPVEMMRGVMYWGEVPDVLVWVWGSLASAATAALGFVWFQKTRRGFADVI
ncbi:MAG: ABC transporter permease [Hydrogenophaga sp.]|nr:ABC transporter permease [Hydrogenophaga sp.]